MNVYEITGTQLDLLLASLNTEASIDKLSVAIDGGVKFKINERMWTPALGQFKINERLGTPGLGEQQR
jgi:hypothetical protein